MNKGEQALNAFWNIFSKRMWLDGVKMKECLGSYHPSEIHCIEHIAKNADANVTELSDAFHMTRSAVSKLTKKMMKKELIESYQKPGNQKEICFRLTASGASVNKIHEEIHKEYRERDKSVLENISHEQYDAMVAFAERYNRHLDAEIEKLRGEPLQRGPDRL